MTPDLEMNPDEELLFLAADNRHSRRRRRARWIYGLADRIFYASLLLFALLAFRMFLDFVTPYLLIS